MPIYEFECGSCGHRFDRLQKLSDTDPVVCPACDAPHLRRMVSAPSFRLAGGGWYETDFKKDGDRKRNLAGDAGQPGAAAASPAPAPAPATRNSRNRPG
jgi:putative FmdB family regulatory protein